ncbi:MAG: potassium transporter TrkG [Oscillospiraceae bacterium]|nr:potassium transporter TrkG [Oscillospiraceae bacterium]
MEKRRFSFSTSQIILLGFLAVIMLGTILLSLPISTKSGKAISFCDALFTATTATCVTGLVTVPTVSWSIFGKAVILLLIQIGGLGVVSIMSVIFIALNHGLDLKSSLLVQDAFNLNSLSGLTTFVKKIVIGSLLVEGIGALVFMPIFVPEFGAEGIFISIFHSVSAFCNAGMDIIGENSLYNYVGNPVINIMTAILIILGGIGFIVWWDVSRVLKLKQKTSIKIWKNLTLHSKIAISTTLFFILSGAVLFFALEYNNPLTIGKLSIGEKIEASFFQSVTTRTAGFATVPQENLTNASALVSMLLMFIGGSPVGTAGGVKTVTITVLFLSALSMVKNKKDATIFNRRISKASINKSLAVVVISSMIVFGSTLLLSLTIDRALIDILYETISAGATVGLSRNLTPSLNVAGKLIIIATMYFGRVGPISLATSLNLNTSNNNIVKNPTEEISIG